MNRTENVPPHPQQKEQDYGGWRWERAWQLLQTARGRVYLSKEAKSEQAGQVAGCGRVRAQGSHCRFDAGLGAESRGQPSLSARSLSSADGEFSVGD